MPRYYCDYCDTHLTHDSPSVRKQHNAGYKHKANVRAYYQQFEEQQTQSLIDQKVKEHLGQQAAFQQFAAFQSGPYKPPVVPVLPRPLPLPGSSPASTAASFMSPIRPPVLPPPGFNAAQASLSFRPPLGSAPASTFSPIQGNGVIRPPTLPLPGPPVIQSAGLSSSNAASGAPVPATLNSYPHSASVATSGPYGSFNSGLQPAAPAGTFSQPHSSDANIASSNFASQMPNSSLAPGPFMFAQTSSGQPAVGQTTSAPLASPPGALVGYQS